jgi:hypothetical protein
VASDEEGGMTIEEDFETVSAGASGSSNPHARRNFDDALSRIEVFVREGEGNRQLWKNCMDAKDECYHQRDSLKAALENTERVLHDWLTGRPQHIHELVAHELAAIRQVLKESGA